MFQLPLTKLHFLTFAIFQMTLPISLSISLVIYYFFYISIYPIRSAAVQTAEPTEPTEDARATQLARLRHHLATQLLP